MKSALDWKRFYADERRQLGPAGLAALIDVASPIKGGWPKHGAVVFPHTRLTISGRMVAAVARGIIESRFDTVLAIGVLHRRTAGDPPRSASERGVHQPEEPICADEFSLDNLAAMLEAAAAHLGRPKPTLIAHYPILAGAEPTAIAGFDELRTWLDRGAALVATADPIHHGVGYDTPPNELRDDLNPATMTWAQQTIKTHVDLLCRGDWARFTDDCSRIRSDFRDAGPVLAALLEATAKTPLAQQLLDIQLVNYCDVLPAGRPTWVGGALFMLRKQEDGYNSQAAK